MAEEQILNNDIEILEHHLQQNPVYVENIQTELNDKKDALENLYKYQAQGAYVRSRAKYKVEGEKPTRLFCSLEKYNGTQKYVPQIIIAGDNNTEVMVEDQKTIEKEIYKFYKDLFSCKDNFIEIDSIQTFLGPQGIENAPTLSEGDKVAMEGKITVEEMTKYIKKCKNNVAPGSTGFTYEFYKFFWRNLKTFVINSVDHSFEKNRLSVCQSLGIVSLIPKGEKDKRYLTNWRPITLLNSLYKLISGCIAERIKPVLDKIINPDQKGFVAGRYIGEAIRTTFDIMQYAKEYNIAGLILLIDFEKAYDSISFKYITKVLNFFNFGQDLIKWVEILLNNFTAVINHCGNISSAFNIGRGCRQGDPIASYLFILCIEILAIRLRSDSQIQSLKLGNISHLMEIYADDLTIYLEPNGENLRHVINILKDFYKLSGLKISVTKTKAVWIGSKHATNEKLCRDLNLQWVKKFTLLGVQFDNALENMKENFRLKLESIENMLSSWTYRYLTPFGKITVIKSLGLSKLSHVALVITNPSKDMIKKVEKVFFSFLWGKGSEKVRREDSKLPLLLGGLGMPDIMNFWTSFKFSWLRRLLTSNAFWPSLLLQEISNIRNSYTTSSDLLQLGVTKLNEISKHIKNPFWKQVLTSVSSVTEGSIFCSPGKLLDHSFWYNPTIKRARVIKHIDFPELQDKIATLADFFIPGTNSFLSHNQFGERYSVQLNLEKFIDIRFAINLALQKLKLPQTRLNVVQLPQRPIIIDIALSSRKGCSFYSKLLSKKASLNNKIYLREAKWHVELGSNFSVDFWVNARRLCSEIDFDNQLRWLQYQILRNSLQTNVIVSKFKRDVSQICSYCQNANSLELISHLFWSCHIVTDFLNTVFTFISNTGIHFQPTKIQFIFGNSNYKVYEPENYISLILKKYIWQSKFKSKQLAINRFMSLLKSYILDLKFMFDYKKMSEKFNNWQLILDVL